ncbi:cytochrome b [Jhaorihella thermophila]|uniref:Cytochrome b561 n=1 Tax=Jhaorihella thermophila TaxID=488547 RepID=A0A1H5Z4E4_9RHOB|nr:cytochrome b/b6 domain-containing protein [Jhaorihella thermophila]SEG30236.1 cytochrome b561 [Jhaorihella thermophila]
MMSGTLVNTPNRFGLITRLLHWATAIAVLGLLVLGTYIARMQVNLSNLWLFGLHKSIGVTALLLTLLRIAWHIWTPPPPPLPDARWRIALARAVHRAIYALLLLTPIFGWAASSATGLDVVVFNRWTLPAMAPVSEAWETALFLIHRVLATTLAVLIVVHVAGALTRRDGTLWRMIWGRPVPPHGA